ALRHFRLVVAYQPDNAQAYIDLGDVLRQKGDLESSAHAFDTALSLKPDLHEGYEGLASTLKQLATAHLPQQPGPTHQPRGQAGQLYRRSLEMLMQGDVSGAKEKLRAALQIDPEYAEAHNLLGFVEGQSSNIDAAVDHLNRAIRLNPAFAQAHYN